MQNKWIRGISALLLSAMLCTALPQPALAESDFSQAETYEGEEMSDMTGDIYNDEDTVSAAADTAQQYITLKRGDKDGEDSLARIVLLQNRLIELGYLYDSADGTYGANTEEAVMLFQRANNLAETGIADPALQNLIFNGTNVVTADALLDSKSAIARVQAKLVLWGFMTGTVDGVNGKTTQECISNFKEYLVDYLKVYPTPTPEPTTVIAPEDITGYSDGEIVLDVPLKKEAAASGEITEEIMDFIDGTYEFHVYRQDVQKGDKNIEARRVQRRLKQLKYLYVADGSFGENSERALIYFQKKNGLSQTGIADEKTQKLLFSDEAVVSEEFVNPYKLVVDISEQRVYLYQWDGDGYNTFLGKSICSTGKTGYDTPLGTYQASGPTGTGEWYYFKEYDCYAKWGYRIVGGILFHSVTYSKAKKLNHYSVGNLGKKASHGCIRMEVAKAEWIYKNCPAGTTVVIQE